ncbi:MAG: septum formation initiator family protein [Thermaceae bacterium]|nr:septum formation initiator family protein [Thermaceae bacterium]
MDRPIYRFLHLIFALGTLHLLVLMGLEVERFFQTRSEIRATQAQIRGLEQSVAQLSSEVDSAQTPAFREAMARRMGYVQQNEILYPKAALTAPQSSKPSH